jgi:hypothetical protein
MQFGWLSLDIFGRLFLISALGILNELIFLPYLQYRHLLCIVNYILLYYKTPYIVTNLLLRVILKVRYVVSFLLVFVNIIHKHKNNFSVEQISLCQTDISITECHLLPKKLIFFVCALIVLWSFSTENLLSIDPEQRRNRHINTLRMKRNPLYSKTPSVPHS